MHPNLFTKAYLTSDEILEVLDHALNSFNVTFDSDYSRDDILVGFFTFADFPSVYERFCKKNFPSWLKEDYTNPAFYEYFKQFYCQITKQTKMIAVNVKKLLIILIS